MTESAPVVEVDMPVRRPAGEVYAAFADPEQITQFRLARASASLRDVITTAGSFDELVSGALRRALAE